MSQYPPTVRNNFSTIVRHIHIVCIYVLTIFIALYSSDVKDKKWHYQDGAPCSKPVVQEVVRAVWNPYVDEKGKFSVAQVAFTTLEVSFYTKLVSYL